MKRFLALGLISLLVVTVGLKAQDKVELEKAEVPSRLEIKADLVEVYDGKKAVGEETVIIVNRETLYSNSTVIIVMADLKFEYPDGRTELIPTEIAYAISHYGDIGIKLEKGDFNEDGMTDVLLTYKSGDKELILFNSERQSIDVIPFEEKEESK